MLGIQAAISVTRLRLTEHFRRTSGAHAFDLIKQGNESPTLVSERLDFASKLLGSPAELRMPGDLRFRALNDELSQVGIVTGDHCLLLGDLCRQRRYETFLLDLGAEASRSSETRKCSSR